MVKSDLSVLSDLKKLAEQLFKGKPYKIEESFITQALKERATYDNLADRGLRPSPSDVTPTARQLGIAQQEVVPNPKGGKRANSSVLSMIGSMRDCVTYTPTKGSKFQLSKVVVSCVLPTWVYFEWNLQAVSTVRLMDFKSILIEHFPYDWLEMIGDGTKYFAIRAEAWAGAGSGGLVTGEIYGEEI